MESRNGKWVNVDYTTPSPSSSFAAPSPSVNPPSRSAAPGDDYAIHITVSEPVKQGDGMNAYISYKISTSTTRPQFSKASFSVIRRYSDFVWLHTSLVAMYPGVVVPPLPEKLLVGRFSPEFIETRRRALQSFLQRCSMHPELQHSDHLTAFLEASDVAMAAFKADPKNAAARNGRGALFQWLNTISSTLGTSAAGDTLVKTAADLEVEDAMAYIDGLEPIMTGLHKHAHGLTKRAREIADGLYEFGVAYAQLGKSEENTSLQQALCEIGACGDRLAALAAERAEKEALHFEEPLLDYIRLVGAVKAALQERNDVRGVYASAVADLEAKTAIAQKAHQGVSPDKRQQAEAEVMKAQQHTDDAKLEYDIVTERVLREVERFKREKYADFKRIVLDYVQMQVDYSKKVEDEWSAVLPKLAQIHMEHGETTSLSPTAEETSGSTTPAMSNSFLQEDYIPSDGASPQRPTEEPPIDVEGELSSNLMSLLLDEDEEDGFTPMRNRDQGSNGAKHSTPYQQALYHSDVTI